MSRGLDDNRSVTRVLLEQNPTIKRIAWAFGCAKKGSDAELELYNIRRQTAGDEVKAWRLSSEFVFETCPTCRQIVGVEGRTALKARLKRHTYAENRINLAQAIGRGGDPFPAYEPIESVQHVACSSSGHRSVEWLRRAAQTKLARQIEREVAVQPDAMVAVDAFAEGREVFKFDKLLNIAIKKHVRLFGPGQRGKTVVRTEQLRHRERRGSVNSFYRMDVYCRFCGGLVVPALNTASNPEVMPRVKSHTMRCALECLAGMREMRGSDHKGLIDEDRAFP